MALLTSAYAYVFMFIFEKFTEAWIGFIMRHFEKCRTPAWFIVKTFFIKECFHWARSEQSKAMPNETKLIKAFDYVIDEKRQKNKLLN